MFLLISKQLDSLQKSVKVTLCKGFKSQTHTHTQKTKQTNKQKGFKSLLENLLETIGNDVFGYYLKSRNKKQLSY